MRRIILVAVLFNFSLVRAQTFKEMKLQKEQQEREKDDARYFDKDDKDFDVTEVPDKWKNESAVILCEKFSFSYFRKTYPTSNTAEFRAEETARKRIKLQDKAAVETFSTFRFSSEAKFGLHVIKPSGKVEEIDLSKAIGENDRTVPGIFRPHVIHGTYKKLAVPNLEIGDIVDFYYSSHNGFEAQKNADWPYETVRVVLNSQYPKMKSVIFFNLEKGFFLNFNAYNTDIKLKEGEAGVNEHGKTRESIQTYTLTVTDLEKLPDEKWVYEYDNYPTVKFQVVAAKANATKNSLYFLGEQGKPKTSVTKKEIGIVLSRNILENTDFYRSSGAFLFVEKFLKKNFPNERDPEKLMAEAYYTLRFYYANENYYYYQYRRPTERSIKFIQNEVAVNNEAFYGVMGALAKKHKITIESVVMMPRYAGSFENALTIDDLNIGIRVNQRLILTAPNFYRLHTEIDPVFEGTQALILVPGKDTNKISLSEITIPTSMPEANKIVMEVDAVMDFESELVNIKRKHTYTGQYKNEAPIEAVLPDNINSKDAGIYDPEGKYAEIKLVTFEEQKEFDKKVKESIKTNLDRQFDLEEMNSFSVTSTGRITGDETFIFEDAFTVRNMMNKAGPNYTFNLGQIIGTQLRLAGSELNRKTDIDLDYARALEVNAKIELPEGYTVEGLDDMNVNIDNASMSFVAKAVLEGKTIQLTVKKEYKVNHDSKANWKNWIDVLEAAYNYTQKKVVLKKA